MYKIFADDVLIFDSTLPDYKIGQGTVTLEAGKSGSFVFSVYPEHFFYSNFVALRTVITVYKSGRIVFRGRVLDEAVDYWNCKTITCEGELGFLQDTIARPFSFTGSPAALFKKFLDDHNAQVDDFKKFKLGTVTVADGNDYINRSTADYPTTLGVLGSALTDSALGGSLYVTHGDGGTDPTPTLHYVADFPRTAAQSIRFGENLTDYTKTAKAEDLATAIIPLGTNTSSDGGRLTIASINGGKDYVYSPAAVALRGWVFQTVVWEDVTLASNLKAKAEAYLADVVNQHITIELSAIDLHLLDRSIESFCVCDYVHVSSPPHGFDATMLCSKQTMDLLKPENDTVTLGYSVASFTGTTNQMAASVSSLGRTVSTIAQDASSIKLTVEEQGKSLSSLELTTDSIRTAVTDQANWISSIEQYMDSITLSVSNGVESSIIKLMAGSAEIASQTIKMSGVVTFTGLAAGTTTIDGGCIKTGTIAAERLNLSGAITWGDLSTGVQADIDDAYNIATNAESLAADLDDTVSGWRYGSTTYIDGSMLKTGTVMASNLLGGMVGLLDADEEIVGGIDITNTQTGYGLEFWTYYGGIRLSAGGNFWVDADYGSMGITSSGLVCSADVVPESGSTYSLGTSGKRWSEVYADTDTIQTSDQNRKHDIEDLPQKYVDLLMGLTPKRYKLNNGSSGRYHTGFIAQEVEAGMARHGIDPLEFAGWVKDVGDNGEDVYMLRYGEFIALLLAAVKAQAARLEKLEAVG